MDNLFLYVLLAVAGIALLVFLIRQNQKDKKAFEAQQNADYSKRKDEEGDIDADPDRDDKL